MTARTKIQHSQLSETDFQRLSRFIESQFGIKMPPSKRMMLQARLQKRLRELGYSVYGDYVNFIFSRDGKDEILRMIDEVTTNKTEFFREGEQFEFLMKIVLPELVKMKENSSKLINIWSAGCSTGEEPYSIAMICEEFFVTRKDFNYEILATDLSRKVLEHAKTAVYDRQRIESIPVSFRKKYLLKSKTRPDEIFRIVPEIRARVKFKMHNLMTRDNFMDRKFDMIFCRNVMIYFDQENQSELTKKFYQHMNAKGYLFIGHSETLMGGNGLFEMVHPKVYRKI